MSIVPAAAIFAQVSGQSISVVETMALILVFFLIFVWISGSIATGDDRPWLSRFLIWGFVVKMAGAMARYYMVAVLYEAGDSFAYHEAGQIMARAWRGFSIPVSDAGSLGTAFTEVATGFIYAIYTPTYFGSFLIFATLSFAGQILFYSAFRPWMSSRKQKLYALAIFFLPSMIFWPSSPGKDALMVLFLGAASYGASRLLRKTSFASLLIIAPALFLAASIRPHIAGVFGLALVLALLFGKTGQMLSGPKRTALFLLSVAGAVAVLAAFASTFSVSLEGGGGTQDLGGFLEDVSEQTSTGGSEITGGSISLSRLPIAIITVLFRPLIHEGTSPQVLMSALEGTFLLGLVIYKFPQMWRNKRLLREKSLLMVYFFYTGGFIVGFSAILNLGILARQRVQVLPMFLALLVALGWPEPEPESTRIEGREPGQRHAGRTPGHNRDESN